MGILSHYPLSDRQTDSIITATPDSVITVHEAGTYQITWSARVIQDANLSIAVNGIFNPDIGEYHIKASANQINIGYGLIVLASEDTVELKTVGANAIFDYVDINNVGYVVAELQLIKLLNIKVLKNKNMKGFCKKELKVGRFRWIVLFSI
jgi:hypothetical protein